MAFGLKKKYLNYHFSTPFSFPYWLYWRELLVYPNTVRLSARHPSVCLYVCLPVTRLSVCSSVCPSPVCLSFCLPVTRLSVCLSAHPPICLSVRLSVRPSTRLSARPPVFHSASSFPDFWPGCTKCIWLIEWWMRGGPADWQASLIGYLLCLLLPHLVADILQTLLSCYGHIEDAHVTFWKCLGNFLKKFICRWTQSFFQHVLNRWHLLCVIKSSLTFRLTFFKPCTIVLDTLKMCMWAFWKFWGIFWKNLLVVELSHFSSMFWIDSTYFMQSTSLTPLGWHSSNFVPLIWTHWRCACNFLEDLKNLHVVELSHFPNILNKLHLLITFIIMDNFFFWATQPFLFLNQFSFALHEDIWLKFDIWLCFR
jgi:hypothetical protein